jgi:hypothetical protein
MISCRVPGYWSIQKAELEVRPVPQGDKYMVVIMTAIVPIPDYLMDDYGPLTAESYSYMSYSQN